MRTTGCQQKVRRQKLKYVDLIHCSREWNIEYPIFKQKLIITTPPPPPQVNSFEFQCCNCTPEAVCFTCQLVPKQVTNHLFKKKKRQQCGNKIQYSCEGDNQVPSPPFFSVHSLWPVLSVVLHIHQISPCRCFLLQWNYKKTINKTPSC